MKTQTLTLTALATLLLAALLATLWALPAQAHWPRTVAENVAIATDPDVIEDLPCALTFPNGRVLVAYHHDYNGIIYQIINRFGNFEFPPMTQLAPGLPQWINSGIPEVLSDEQGGAYVVWSTIGSGPDSLFGIYTQHLDSLGNRLWGDSALRIFPAEAAGLSNMPICPDGQGGFFMAWTGGTQHNLLVQHVNGNGNLPWGPTGIYVCGYPIGRTSGPRIASDQAGGCNVIWTDTIQNPIGVYGQRLDEQGNLLWVSNGIRLADIDMDHKLISDGTGGVIMQTTIWDQDYNKHIRIDTNGQIIATRDHLSWGQLGSMILGEQNYFYLGFLYTWGYDVYGQRVDLNLNPHWFGTNGAIICSRPGWGATGDLAFSYGYPYYYFAGGLQIVSGTQVDLITQYLDTLANRKMGDNGTILSSISIGTYFYTNVIPIEGDIVVVYQVHVPGYNVWAKRCHADGTLGGPFPLGVTVTPRHPPIQIPPQGGSFSFDIAVADTDSVGGPFDAWIEVTLPGNRTHPITARRHLNMPTGATITKPNLTQVVPANAPAGLYTYRFCAGDDSFKIPWGEGSFTFEKVVGRSSLVVGEELSQNNNEQSLRGTKSRSNPVETSNEIASLSLAMTTPSSGMTDDLEGWTLSGDFFKEGDIPARNAYAEFQRLELQPIQLDAHPNPFNPDVEVFFKQPVGGIVNLSVYDVSGRKVAELANGYRHGGEQNLTFDGSNLPSGVYFIRLIAGQQTAVKKVLLVK
ncbi:MAG: T9SS type A sorting domain-containing protein [bacterium]|nr:T9SS type A sorting domain-containing protein [bacterium]